MPAQLENWNLAPTGFVEDPEAIRQFDEYSLRVLQHGKWEQHFSSLPIAPEVSLRDDCAGDDITDVHHCRFPWKYHGVPDAARGRTVTSNVERCRTKRTWPPPHNYF